MMRLGWLPRTVLAFVVGMLAFGLLTDLHSYNSTLRERSYWDFSAICMHPHPDENPGSDRLTERCLDRIEEDVRNRWSVRTVFWTPFRWHFIEDHNFLNVTALLAFVVVILIANTRWIFRNFRVILAIEPILQGSQPRRRLGWYARLCVSAALWCTVVFGIMALNGYVEWPRQPTTLEWENRCMDLVLSDGWRDNFVRCVQAMPPPQAVRMPTLTGLRHYFTIYALLIAAYALLCCYIFFAVRWIRKAPGMIWDGSAPNAATTPGEIPPHQQ